MYLCYIDESGTSDIPGNSSYFILAGIAIPIWHWKNADNDINTIKSTYGLADAEIHTAWMLRQYPEQNKIPDFETLDWESRRHAVNKLRASRILSLQKKGDSKGLKQEKKNYAKTDAYRHLTYNQRKQFLLETAKFVGNWGFARLFAECIDKLNFHPRNPEITPERMAFEQVVSRFEHFLASIKNDKHFGLLIHDNNDTVSKKHTELMKKFHREGTLFNKIQHIIETPLFVNSQLTSMVQIADLCAYALRRYFENGEEELFSSLFQRADRRDDSVVGVRHYTPSGCSCKVCQARGRESIEP